ncbi:N-acetyltransferase [Pseudoflavonifractor sp. 524-17]|uniref:GNAT family N-acetyltransferase n=1 Tax=Pseudoflavonifractor sp. 524-17 TaxID=2304577 RepID=UPI00137A7C23|nr:GNAT family N-acetyltransferase [Pseudoflavonifractor sp. 524-17]NCE65004.1 N-acetyltransferase [Pseudoflavonifractor sp. 524-17]
MEYRENALTYEDYLRLRAAVGWRNFSGAQTQRALRASLYTVTAAHQGQIVGMGRLIGDGMYYVIVDVVVHPRFQRRGTGSKITDMLTEYVRRETPAGGRSSIQLTAEKGREAFYERAGFKPIPHDHCGCGMRKVIYSAAPDGAGQDADCPGGKNFS